jgi:phage terminase large subunit-like protein
LLSDEHAAGEIAHRVHYQQVFKRKVVHILGEPQRGGRERKGSNAEIEAGHVHLPETAPWLGEFLSELLAFPNGRHDDQFDSLSQFLLWWQRANFQSNVTIVMPFSVSQPRTFPG